MNTRGLEAFVAVAGTLNFTKAAEQLFITQPALSRLIAALEAELGIKLLSRTTRTVELTEAGKLLLPLAEGVLRGCEDLLRAAERAPARHGRRAELRLQSPGRPAGCHGRDPCGVFQELSQRGGGCAAGILPPARRRRARRGPWTAPWSLMLIWDGVKELDFLPLQRFGLYALLRRDDPRAAFLPLSVHSLEGASLTIMKETAPRPTTP